MREKWTKIGAFVAVAGMALTGRAVELDLAGEWTLSGSNEVGAAISCPIAVPGGVHEALIKNGTISDPYFGDNEKLVQWVGRRDWTISRTFDVGGDLLAEKSVILRLENVDTYAKIYLNGKLVGETDNAFRRWEFDVKGLLKLGANEIRGEFRSAEKEGERIQKEKYGDFLYSTIVPTIRWMALMRKTQCHGGWDWGPTLMEVGFAGRVSLIGEDFCRIDYVHCDQSFNEDFSKVTLTFNVEAHSPKGGETDLAVDGFRSVRVTLKPGQNLLRLPIEIEKPILWWPHDQGESHLYRFTLHLGDHVVEKRIGLRKVELVSEPDTDLVSGKEALSFALKMNGRFVFVKGFNWIPADAILDRQTTARCRDLLESAKAANANLIRVWGGGKYESDDFYAICDELGLMVWQDLMFACANYPSDDEYLANVGEELKFNVKRLKDHASLALWCGDNECNAIPVWDFLPECTKDLQPKYIDNLKRRHDYCAKVIREIDADHPWWPTSPASTPEGFSDDFYLDIKGDLHTWDVWYGNKPFETWYTMRPRFCDEYGYQSFSSVGLCRANVKLEDFSLTAPAFDNHQKAGKSGWRAAFRPAPPADLSACIVNAMMREFRLPSSTENMIRLSQPLQAKALVTAINGWRSLKPWCMGVAVWQLNDVWPSTSWSTVEYGGKWKQSMYQVKRAFAPVRICTSSTYSVGFGKALEGGTNVIFTAVNDLPRPVEVRGEIVVRTYVGEVIERRPCVLRLEANSTRCVMDAAYNGFGMETERANRFLTFDYEVLDGANVWTDRAEWFFTRFANAPIADPSLAFSAEERDGKWRVVVRVAKPAFYVWAETSVRGEFDDNSLTLVPGETRTLVFMPKDLNATLADFKRDLKVSSLYEICR